MRSKRAIRLTSQQARRMLRVDSPRRKKSSSQSRVSPEIWGQIDAMRRSVSAAKPWLMVPGLHIRLTGQLPSGKNRQGIRVEQEQVITDGGVVMDIPSIVKHPRKRFTKWREESLKELVPQLQSWRGLFSVTVPMMMYVWYWPSDRRVRDRSGMLDAMFHVFERAGMIADDGLVEDPLWRTMELDRECPRVEIVLRPFVMPESVMGMEDWTCFMGCPCCALPQVS